MAVWRMFLPARNAATRSSGAWIAGRLRAIQPRQIDVGDRATAGAEMLRNLSGRTAEAVDGEDQDGGWRRPQNMT